MSKTWLIVVILGLIMVMGGGWLLWQMQQPKSDKQTSPLSALSATRVPSPSGSQFEALVDYEDPAGFSFSYPEELKLTTAEDFDDQTDYAKLIVQGAGGQVEIWLTDTKHKKVSDWLAKDAKAPKQTILMGANTLGGIPAEQYSDSTNLYTLAIDQGVLYYIASPKGAKWEKVHESIVESFKFVGEPTGAATSGSGSGGETIYEEEEVIE